MSILVIIFCCLYCTAGLAQGPYNGGTASSAAIGIYNSGQNCLFFGGGTASSAAIGVYNSGQNCLFFGGGTASTSSSSNFDNPAACPAYYASLNGRDAYDARSYLEDAGVCYEIILETESSPLFAKIEAQEGLLYWSTYSETDNKGYAIQKSFDAIHWETIGWINGMNNHVGTVNYQFVDEMLSYTHQYYRTIQQDYSGDQQISNVVHLHPSRPSSNATKQISVFPNPVRRGQNIRIRSWIDHEIAASFRMYNAMGQLILQQPIRFNSFDQIDEISTSDLASGNYFVHILGDQGEFSLQYKIIVIP